MKKDGCLRNNKTPTNCRHGPDGNLAESFNEFEKLYSGFRI